MKLILQVALDFLNLGRALKIAEAAVAGGADWLEAGTPLIKSEGLDSVRALKKNFPGLPIVADLKIMDAGRIEAEAAFKNAIDKLKRAISRQPTEETIPPLYIELGNVYLKLERYKEAEAAFNDALQINPKLVSAHYGMAGAYLKQNLPDEALNELQKVIELAPDSQEAKYARDAIQKIEQAKLESQPTN